MSTEKPNLTVVGAIAAPVFLPTLDMLNFAGKLRELANGIEVGEFQAAAITAVHRDAGYSVTSGWFADTGGCALIGGLFQQLNEIANRRQGVVFHAEDS
jgi:hypothetical protein